jgi:putative ABC transport system substrate-binding protein
MTVLASAAAHPLLAGAQQKAMPVIGFLGSTAPGPYATFVAAFLQGLQDAGYVVGQNVSIEYRWAEGHFDRLSALAADFVARKIDVIATSGGIPAARAAQNATSAIPIVFMGIGDPVGAGLVASFSRPGGNVTGMSFFTNELSLKRLELLSELVPQARMIAILVNPNSPFCRVHGTKRARRVRAKEVQVQILKAGTEGDFGSAFASLVQTRAGALLDASDPFFNSRREELVALAARHAVPAIYEWREFAAIGGLISYGPSSTDIWRQAGAYVGRILAGAKPADLPVQQPTTFELVINLKTAKALGLTVPPTILARADEVIE